MTSALAAAPPPADPFAPEMATVTRVRRESPDVWTLLLDLGRPFAFDPGQFNMLQALGVGEAAISVSGDPGRPGEIRHTIRAVGAVTRALTGTRRGGEVGVRGPYGRGWPIDAQVGKDVVVMGGGVGLAPLRPVLVELARRRGEFGRVTLLVGARTPEHLLFRADLERFRKRFDVAISVDTADAAWRGNTGVVTKLVPGAVKDGARTVAFLCGPEIMMRFGARELIRAGLPEASVFVSLERNMKCGVGHCGHCQLGPALLCRDGPVTSWDRIGRFLTVREL